MLIYGKYGIEKADTYNFQVLKYGTTKDGKETRTVLTYHGDFLSATKRVRKNLQMDGMTSDSMETAKYLKKLEKLDLDFETFLSSIDIKQLAVLLTPPEKPKVEKVKTPESEEEEVVEEVA